MKPKKPRLQLFSVMVFLVGAIALTQTPHWGQLLVAILAGAYLYFKNKSSPSAVTPIKIASAFPRPAGSEPRGSGRTHASAELPLFKATPEVPKQSGYRIPPPGGSAPVAPAASAAPAAVPAAGAARAPFEAATPAELPADDGLWIPPGQTANVSGIEIPGMVYVGTSLRNGAGVNDPALIDITKLVGSRGDFTIPRNDYWPSYAGFAEHARRAYLDWLADGRRNPHADVAYVYVFLYGLERRVVLGLGSDPEVQAELPAIREELAQLVAVYGPRQAALRGHLSALFELVDLLLPGDVAYDDDWSQFKAVSAYEVPFRLRLALGQAARDEVPLSAPLALAWYSCNPHWRKLPSKCADEFLTLFTKLYHESYGEGLVLQRGSAPLRFKYQPASRGLSGYEPVQMGFAGITDVATQLAPLQLLQHLERYATDVLGPFTRLVARHPDARGTFEALATLPVVLWPKAQASVWAQLVDRARGECVLMQAKELLGLFDPAAVVTKQKVSLLASRLVESGIGFEPNVLAGAKSPGPDEHIALFRLVPAHAYVDGDLVADEEGPPISDSNEGEQALVLSLSVGLVVGPDAENPGALRQWLTKTIDSAADVSPGRKSRLVPQTLLRALRPSTFASLKKLIEGQAVMTPSRLGATAIDALRSCGPLGPTQLKTLTKFYKLIGFDEKQMFSDVHAAESGTVAASRSGFSLDRERIAVLHEDSARASALLANIFVEDTPEPSAPTPTLPAVVTVESAAAMADGAHLPASSSVSECVMGLDPTHSSLAKTLVTRPSWSREELLGLTKGLGLMLDGALEALNDAAFDTQGIPFTEGEDPVEVSAEIQAVVTAGPA